MKQLDGKIFNVEEFLEIGITMKKIGLLLFITLFSLQGNADIYKRVGKYGKVYFTDKRSKGYKRVIRTKPKSYNYSYKNFLKKKQKFSPYVAEAAKKYSVDEKLIHAVIQTESAYNEKAISSAGAVGLMQLMPGTARRYGVSNRSNAKQNIAGGTQYLKDLQKMFKSNLKLVLASYNAGEGAVKKYHNSIPPYPETQNYVRKVLKLYKTL